MTHEIVKRKYIFIPVLISPSFPRRKDETKIELYCQLMLILLKPWRNNKDLKCSEESWLEAFIKFEESLNEDSDVSKIINNINYLKKAETNVEEDVIKKRTSYNVVNNEQVNDFITFKNDDNDNENSIDVMDYMVSNELNFWTENGLDFLRESNNFSVSIEKNLLEEENIQMKNNENRTFST